MVPMSDPLALLPMLDTANRRLLASVDALADAAFAEPSALPDWSRAHVVAHLVLNGEAMAAAVTGVAVGKEVAMYPSQEARDAGVEELSGHPADELRTRLRTAMRGFAGALSLVPEDRWETIIPRLPGSSRTFVASDMVARRLTETEVHHADLAAGYTHHDWDPEFARFLVGRLSAQQSTPCTLRATDLDHGDTEWRTADGEGPTVSGSVADLGWWLTGRGGEDRLTVSGGPMPTIGKW